MEPILFALVVWFSDASMGWPESGATYAQMVSRRTVGIIRKPGGDIIERRCIDRVCREQKIGFVPIFDPPSPPATNRNVPR